MCLPPQQRVCVRPGRSTQQRHFRAPKLRGSGGSRQVPEPPQQRSVSQMASGDSGTPAGVRMAPLVAAARCLGGNSCINEVAPDTAQYPAGPVSCWPPQKHARKCSTTAKVLATQKHMKCNATGRRTDSSTTGQAAHQGGQRQDGCVPRFSRICRLLPPRNTGNASTAIEAHQGGQRQDGRVPRIQQDLSLTASQKHRKCINSNGSSPGRPAAGWVCPTRPAGSVAGRR